MQYLRCRFLCWLILVLYRHSWKVKSTSCRDLPKELHSGNGNKSVEQRRINIQNIRKQGRFTILFIKIVELPRSPCYECSHVSLLQNAPRDRGVETCYRTQKRRSEEKCTETVVQLFDRSQNMKNGVEFSKVVIFISLFLYFFLKYLNFIIFFRSSKNKRICHNKFVPWINFCFRSL